MCRIDTPESCVFNGVMEKEVQFDEHGICLMQGDCLEILPKLPMGLVDAVVTSPPYNTLPKPNINQSGMHKNNSWVKKASNGYFDYRDEGDYLAWILNVFELCRNVCRGLVWVNHKIRYRDGEAIHPARMFPWPIYSEIIWDRGGSLALNCKRYAPSTEHLLGFGTPSVWNDDLNGMMSVWRINPDKNDNDHPCAFPVELVRRPIYSSTPQGGVVLDPFMGSGTTGVACKLLGRKFIGIEIEPKYVEIARRRINSTEAPLFV